ncbi:MAG: response regulator transcription factor [Dehalococcoidales bacterium]|nr:response regulator transcription factor [Dehalococcoidales bacterium]
MKVLIIEDDKRITDIVSLAFQIRWPEAKLIIAHDGETGIGLVEKESPDIVILDLGLPDISGFEVLKAIRLFSSIPVLILTVMNERENIIKGLELGADGYMVKPFDQLEMLARVQAILRRTNLIIDEVPIKIGSLSFGPSLSKLTYKDKYIDITRVEGIILYNLMKNAGNVLTYSKLCKCIWGDEYSGCIESIRVHITRLRTKIEEEPNKPRIICTKVGIGYYIDEKSIE